MKAPDGYRGELTYRLSLRAARFLETDLEKRKDKFFLINRLYKFRSLIAHGTDITQLDKPRDKNDLKRVLEHAPVIVAESIVKLMSFWYEHPDTDDSKFWKEIELGND
jgi:hypothetical protein